MSPLPYTIAPSGEAIDEEAVDDLVPNRIYTKTELLEYLQASREKCHTVIAGLTADC